MLIATGTAAVAQPAAPVVVAPVARDSVGASQEYVATVEPSQRALVGSAVDGRISAFPLNAGDRVEAMGTLAEVLTETIKLEKQAAEAELRLACEELNELEAGTRKEEIDRARAEMEAAASANRLAAGNLQRAENFFRAQTTTQAVLDSERSAARVASETLAQKEAALALAEAGPREETIEQAKARVSMHEAMVGKLEDQIRKHTIISRFAGYVVIEHTEVGNWVKRGDPVAEIVALDEVDVVAHVLEAHVPYVKRGMIVPVRIPAVPVELTPGGSGCFRGVVVQVVPQADVRTRTFPVQIRVENVFEPVEGASIAAGEGPPAEEVSASLRTRDPEEGAEVDPPLADEPEAGPVTEPPANGMPVIKSGMLARIRLPTSAIRESLLVPKDALVLGGRTPMVMVVQRKSQSEPAGTVRPVPVTHGTESGGWIAVQGELSPGDEVIVRGNERVRPGQAVNVIEVQPAYEATAADDCGIEPPTAPAAPGVPDKVTSTTPAGTPPAGGE